MVLALAALAFWILTSLKLFVFIAAILLSIGLFSKGLANVISNYWLIFAKIVGNFNSKIILSVIFYVLLLPIAIMYRCFHKDFLNIRKDTTKETYWQKRDHKFGPSDLMNPW